MRVGDKFNFAASARRLAIAIALAGVCATGAWPAHTVSAAMEEGRDGHLAGVDVSHWQGTIRWQAAKADGVQFVIAKATEAQSWTDSQYARNKLKADRLGLPFTAYHFARPDTTSNDAVREADHFVRTAALKPRHMLPVLDLEVHGGLGPKKLIRWTKAWLERVESRLGVKPIIYTSPSFWQERLNDSAWFANNGYTLWIAHWHTNEPRVPASNWGGRGWKLWQLTDCGRVEGIDGCVDVDLMRGTNPESLRIRSNR